MTMGIDKTHWDKFVRFFFQSGLTQGRRLTLSVDGVFPWGPRPNEKGKEEKPN